jgi:hypothetical protein
MFAPLRLPSFYSEKSTKSENDAGLRTPDPDFHELRSKTGEGPGSVQVVVTETDNHEEDDWEIGNGQQLLERRKSRMGLLARYLFSSLTLEPTDQHSTQHVVYRKPVSSAYPDRTTVTTFSEQEKALPVRGYPTQQQDFRAGPVPNMLKKVRRPSPDMHADGGYAPPLPPKSPIPPSAPAVAEVLAAAPETPRLREIKERTRSNSLEGGQPQTSHRYYDGPASPRFRSSSAQPPNARHGYTDPTRIPPVPHTTGSHSRDSSISDGKPEGRKLKRLFHSSRSGSLDGSNTGAWILGPDSNVDYNTSSLANGQRVSYHLLSWRERS